MSKSKKKGSRIHFLSKNKAHTWYITANLFASSFLSMNEAIYEYNKLYSEDRIRIQNLLSLMDEQRKRMLKDVQNEELNERYVSSVFVDAHIIATEYDTDPVVVLMCTSPPCSILDRVVIKQ